MTGTAATFQRERSSAYRQLARDHLPLTVVVSAYVISGLFVERVMGVRHLMDPMAYVPTYAYFLSVSIYSVAVLLVWCRWQIRAPDGGRVGFRDGWRQGAALFQERFGTVERLGGFAIISLLVPILINTTMCWKTAIPRFQPFAWDEALVQADLRLHFGTAPWQWLQPVLGHPRVTWLVDLLYYVWIPSMTGLVFWQAWSPHRRLRAQFFLTYTLGWILLGTVLATLLSSAGPCFYGQIAGSPDPYAPLMHYLRQVDLAYPLISIEVQRILLQQYQQGAVTPWNAISAMPSMHVAMPVVFTLTAWRTHRLLGVAFLVYALIVLIGSVHLGWHYAVDGYVSVCLVLLIWRAAGWFVRRHMGDETVRGVPA
jgi:hypothetical protein